MGNFVFQDLESFPRTIWQEGDPPLVNGAGPVIEPVQPATDRSGLPHWALWLGVLVCVVVGARLVDLLLTLILNDLRLAGAPLPYRPPWIGVGVGSWLIICLLAIVRARRRAHDH